MDKMLNFARDELKTWSLFHFVLDAGLTGIFTILPGWVTRMPIQLQIILSLFTMMAVTGGIAIARALPRKLKQNKEALDWALHFRDCDKHLERCVYVTSATGQLANRAECISIKLQVINYSNVPVSVGDKFNGRIIYDGISLSPKPEIEEIKRIGHASNQIIVIRQPIDIKIAEKVKRGEVTKFQIGSLSISVWPEPPEAVPIHAGMQLCLDDWKVVDLNAS